MPAQNTCQHTLAPSLAPSDSSTDLSEPVSPLRLAKEDQQALPHRLSEEWLRPPSVEPGPQCQPPHPLLSRPTPSVPSSQSPHLQEPRGQSRVCAPPEGETGHCPQWLTFCGPLAMTGIYILSQSHFKHFLPDHFHCFRLRKKEESINVFM